VYTNPSPVPSAEETPVKPLQYKHKQGLIQTRQPLAGEILTLVLTDGGETEEKL